LILVSGFDLARPILIGEWDDTMRVMAGINRRATAPSGELTGRPYYRLALFWGLDWVKYLESGRPLTSLKPEQANQHGRFYPAVGLAPALVVFDDERGEIPDSTRPLGLIRSVEPMTLDVFVRHGLRIRVDAANVSGR
jgi:hypothetical protein